MREKVFFIVLFSFFLFLFFNKAQASGLKVVNPKDVRRSYEKTKQRISEIASQHRHSTSNYPDLEVTGRVRVSVNQRTKYYCNVEFELKNRAGSVPQNEIRNYKVEVVYPTGFTTGYPIPSQLAHPGAVAWYKYPSPLGLAPGEWDFTVKITYPYDQNTRQPKDRNPSNNEKRIHVSCEIPFDIAVVDIKTKKVSNNQCVPIAVVKNVGSVPVPAGLQGSVGFVGNYGYNYNAIYVSGETHYAKLSEKIHNPGQQVEIEGPGAAWFTGTKTVTIKLQTLPFRVEDGRLTGYLRDQNPSNDVMTKTLTCH